MPGDELAAYRYLCGRVGWVVKGSSQPQLTTDATILSMQEIPSPIPPFSPSPYPIHLQQPDTTRHHLPNLPVYHPKKPLILRYATLLKSLGAYTERYAAHGRIPI
jgi:hypothetical protein